MQRAGIVYVSDTDLDWAPVLAAWIWQRPGAEQQALLSHLFMLHVGTCAPEVRSYIICFNFSVYWLSQAPGHLFEFLIRHTSTAAVLSNPRAASITGAANLLSSL